MPPFDWTQLVSPSQWAQKLDELLNSAHAALSQPDAGRRAAGIQESINSLQAYLDNEPGFINDLLQIAKSATADLAIADIGDALNRLADLQNQLHGMVGNEFHTQRFTAPELLPRRRLGQAFYALTALQRQQQELAAGEEVQPGIGRQISELLNTIQLLLNQPPAAPAKARARSENKPKRSK